MNTIRILPLLLAALVALPSAPVSAQSTRERGIGPYNLVTSRGEAPVRLLRRDRDILWVDRQVRTGEFIETGVPVSEIIEFKSPRPPVFDQAEAATTPEQIGAAIDQIRKFTALLRPYRDLPGIPVNDALLLQAKLNERRELWREALLVYQDLLAQPYDFPGKSQIRFQAGLCLWRMEQKDKALEFLMDSPVPDEDLDYMSDLLFARADCLADTGRTREAVETYLHLIVFYPYVRTNELRAFSRAVPGYIAMNEWDAAIKTVEAMKKTYPDAPETAASEELLNKHQEQVAKEKQFQVSQE